MNKRKSKQNAVIRTMANKNALNFATKRLLRDLKELETNEIPTVGVSAQPLEEDLFEWHGNLKGPEGTPFEGGVFHIKLCIPEQYPHKPPTVTLLSTIPHPNVFGSTVCLDMLNPTRQEGIQWTSAYTIQSILLQLQSFLFEKIYFDEELTENKVKKAVANANNFRCTSCKHGGKLSAWPPFSKFENTTEKFKILQSQKELIAQEILCYHTKLGFKEIPLGIGLNISRVPRTGDIKQANPGLDFISLKAFIKEAIRETSNNEKFTHWIPLFFGEDVDRTMYLGKKAISMIFSGCTKRFNETQILKLFPKILLSIGASLMDEKRHPSIVILRLFLRIHCTFLLFLEKFPQTYNEIDNLLETFLSKPEKRTKDTFPALGDLFPYLLVSKKYKVGDFLEPYFEEQLDRQVFWMLKSVPEFETMDESLDSQRSELTFRTESTAYHITLFFSMIIQSVRREKDNGSLLEEYKGLYGTLASEVENHIQKECFKILKVKNYEEYQTYLNLPKVDPHTMVERLKKALTNAKEKKYIGKDDEILSLPTSSDQIKDLISKKPKLEDVITVEETISTEGKTQSHGSWKSEIPENEFRSKCISRWEFVQQALLFDKTLSPFALFQLHKQIVLRDSTILTSTFDFAKYLASSKFDEKDLEDESNISLEVERKLTWKSLFVLLELEERLEFMDQNPDFHFFYSVLSAVKAELEVVVVPYVTLSNLKSGYYYITTLISELTSLKVLYVSSRFLCNFAMSIKFQKALFKGLNNSKENGAKMLALHFYNFNGVAMDPKQHLSKAISSLDTLGSLNFFNTKFTSNGDGKILSAAMIACKNLQELRVVKENISSMQCKEIADGIMRAKNLKHFDISDNPIDPTSMASLVYNLSFSPRLQSLKINFITTAPTPNVIESLFRLLKISASLVSISLKGYTGLSPALNLNFFKALGENLQLEKLDLSTTGLLNKQNEEYLAQAIALNSYNGGNLKVCNTVGIFSRESDLIFFSKALNVSKYDFQNWYGDNTLLHELKGEDYKKVFHCKLQSFNFSNCNLKSNFDLNSFLKKYKPDEHAIVSLIKSSDFLSTLRLVNCQLDKRSLDLLNINLSDSTRKNRIREINLSNNQIGKEGAKVLAFILEANSDIEVFDVSKNNLGVSGAQSIAVALAKNKSVKVLNISENKIDVDGARAFKDVLAVNSTLTYLNLSFNSIRNAGLSSLTEGLAANANSQLKDLEIRSNFLTEDGIIPLLQCLKSKSVERLFIKRNRIGDFAMSLLKKEYETLGLNIFIDSLEKYNYWNEERLARTIWIQPSTFNSVEEVRKFFEETQKCGIVVSVRKRHGTKWKIPNHSNPNSFYFVEFAHPFSVTRAMYVATRKEAIWGGKKFRIFKAGSNCFLYSKLKKSKASTNSQTRGPKPISKRGRGGGRGGRGGRGARGGRGRVA